MRALVKNARRTLQAEHLKPSLAHVERKAGARCYLKCAEKCNRQGWDIETGLHARLDVSLLEDLCRIRTPRSLWVLGLLRRLVGASLWSGARLNPKAIRRRSPIVTPSWAKKTSRPPCVS